MNYGLHLTNGNFNEDIDRIVSLGFNSFIALHHQLDSVLKLKLRLPNAKYLIRFYTKDLLDRSIESVAFEIDGFIHRMYAAGIVDLVVGNEMNHPIEGKVYTPIETASRYYKLLITLKSKWPNIKFHLPAFSPGFAGWEIYVRALYNRCKDLISAVDVHAYGSFNQMAEIVHWHLDYTDHTVVVTEWNFGAGNEVDISDWTRDHGIPFVEYCDNLNIDTHWFIYEWINPDSALKTTVNVKNTEWTNMFTTLRDMKDKELPMPTTPFTFPTVYNYTADRTTRSSYRNIFIHSTRSGIPSNTREQEYRATVNFFQNKLGTGHASAHGVVGPAEVTFMVPDWYGANHAIENNPYSLSLEVAQNLESTPYTEFQYQATAAITRNWCNQYNIPKTRIMSQYLGGIIGHQDSEQGKRYGKTDPGYTWNWSYFMSLVNNEVEDDELTPAQKASVIASLDILWGLANEFEAIPLRNKSPLDAYAAKALKERIVSIKAVAELN